MKIINSLKTIQGIIQCKGNNHSLNEIRQLKIEINNENLSKIDFTYLLSEAFPKCEELIISLNNVKLKDNFLQSLQIYLEKESLLKQLYIQFYRINFSFKQIKLFLLFVKEKFYNNENQSIQYSYRNDSIVLSYGYCQIGFQPEFKNSMLMRELKENNYFINIKQNQQNFLQILQKQIFIDIHDIQVELFHQNQQYVRLSSGKTSSHINIKIEFEQREDLFSFNILEYQIAEINLSIQDFQQAGFKYSTIQQQIKKRHNFSFQIKENITVFSMIEEDNNQSESYINQRIEQYDLNNLNKMNLNTQFKMQFYKKFILSKQIEGNIQAIYDINFYLIQNKEQQIAAKIKYNLSSKNDRKNLEIDFENVNDIIEIIQSYFYILKDFVSQEIKLKLFTLESKQNLNENILLGEINRVDFFKAKVQKLSLNLNFSQMIQEYPFISQLNQIKNISLKIVNFFCLLEFLEKNSSHFRNQQNLINLDVEFKRSQYEFCFQQQQQQKFKDILQTEIYKDYHRLVKINFYKIRLVTNILDKSFLKFQRLTKFCYCPYSKKTPEHVSGWDQSQILLFKQFDEEYEEKGKTHFAYLLITSHDDITCSYSRREFCKCQDNKMKQLLQKPDNFFKMRFFIYDDSSSLVWKEE